MKLFYHLLLLAALCSALLQTVGGSCSRGSCYYPGQCGSCRSGICDFPGECGEDCNCIGNECKHADL
ncbi:hypothetical protein GE061_012159 [Apolygus lucorum]|uniref:Uncharacterized protein n=1 Tax=Apolygus lucorum TaxID=248454 RepID=A0A8S9XU73_APOLU|nr:hypothetical protein GE061_012159 [Apolygus lucorum]